MIPVSVVLLEAANSHMAAREALCQRVRQGRVADSGQCLQAEEAGTADVSSTGRKGSTGGTSSRFAYDMLTEDEAVKAPGVSRGKDGHVSLGDNDFFSNPLGGSASTRK